MYSVVLDVPNDAENIFLGVLLNGTGQRWADDLAVEVVDRNIAVTSMGSAQEATADNPAYAKIPKATIKRTLISVRLCKFIEGNGAGDEDRTRNFQLGKVT